MPRLNTAAVSPSAPSNHPPLESGVVTLESLPETARGSPEQELQDLFALGESLQKSTMSPLPACPIDEDTFDPKASNDQRRQRRLAKQRERQQDEVDVGWRAANVSSTQQSDHEAASKGAAGHCGVHFGDSETKWVTMLCTAW